MKEPSASLPLRHCSHPCAYARWALPTTCWLSQSCRDFPLCPPCGRGRAMGPGLYETSKNHFITVYICEVLLPSIYDGHTSYPILLDIFCEAHGAVTRTILLSHSYIIPHFCLFVKRNRVFNEKRLSCRLYPSYNKPCISGTVESFRPLHQPFFFFCSCKRGKSCSLPQINIDRHKNRCHIANLAHKSFFVIIPNLIVCKCGVSPPARHF